MSTRVCALQTARAGSKGVPGKNLLRVGGLPLYRFNLLHALASRRVDSVFVSTDSDEILRDAKLQPWHAIGRPPELSQDGSSHEAVIRHGLQEMERRIGCKVDIAVIVLGNSLGALPEDLDAAVNLLEVTPEADSVESVSTFNMFNPFRAKRIVDGVLQTVVPQEWIRDETAVGLSNERCVGGDIQFFNGSFWICRRRAIIEPRGQLPFPWLGQRILPFQQREIWMELDEPWQTPLMGMMADRLRSAPHIRNHGAS